MAEKEFEAMKKVADANFTLDKIKLDFVADLVYNSLSFEKRDITRNDVYNIISDKLVDLDEKIIKVTLNHRKAFMFLLNLITKNEELTESKLKDCHAILMDDNGGLYRNVDISIHGSTHTPPSHLKVYTRMKQYFDVLLTPSENPLEKIAYSHLQLAKIHPFLDGNGRLSRLILNYYMLKAGLAPVIIPSNEKEKYFSFLEDYKVKKIQKPFIDYLITLENQTINKYFK